MRFRAVGYGKLVAGIKTRSGVWALDGFGNEPLGRDSGKEAKLGMDGLLGSVHSHSLLPARPSWSDHGSLKLCQKQGPFLVSPEQKAAQGTRSSVPQRKAFSLPKPTVSFHREGNESPFSRSLFRDPFLKPRLRFLRWGNLPLSEARKNKILSLRPPRSLPWNGRSLPSVCRKVGELDRIQSTLQNRQKNPHIKSTAAWPVTLEDCLNTLSFNKHGSGQGRSLKGKFSNTLLSASRMVKGRLNDVTRPLKDTFGPIEKVTVTSMQQVAFRVYPGSCPRGLPIRVLFFPWKLASSPGKTSSA